MKHLFVIPGPGSVLSGGNRYNDALLVELGRQLPIARTDSLGLPQLDLTAEGLQTVWLDSLYLALAPDLRQRLGPQVRLYLLAHSLPSLLEQASHNLSTPPPSSVERERSWLAALHGAMAVSQTMAGWLHQRVPKLPVWVAEPAICAARRTLVSALPLQAVMVANLVPNKGVLSFLRALRAQTSPSDRLRLRCFGSHAVDQAYATACRAELEDTSLSTRVELPGSTSHQQVLHALGGSHVLVSASRLESFGMAIADARASGCIVLARAGGHTERLVEPAAGGEVVSADSELAAALLRLVRDPAELSARSLLAQRTPLAPRSWSRVAEPFLHLLSAAQPDRYDQ